jgi:hypothetical protein
MRNLRCGNVRSKHFQFPSNGCQQRAGLPAIVADSSQLRKRDAHAASTRTSPPHQDGTREHECAAPPVRRKRAETSLRGERLETFLYCTAKYTPSACRCCTSWSASLPSSACCISSGCARGRMILGSLLGWRVWNKFRYARLREG